ncbi:MAG: (Fe-S)-binding protein [Gemmatimonadaceae bacterium]
MREAPACALPDSLASVLPGIMTCVHCGFCLQACPTYRVLGDENDSPRGRIRLMRAVVEGDLAIDDPALETHIDRCLGCRACETACPSGVPYGQLLEAARAEMLQHRRRLPFIARVVLWVFARPVPLAFVLWSARVLRGTGTPALLARLGGKPGAMMAMLHATRPVFRTRPYTRRGTGERGIVTQLEGCVMKGLLSGTNAATARTLTVNGYSLIDTPGQRCCGALHAHAGDLAVARDLARLNVAAFEASGAELIAVNAAGCGAMMKDYGHLLHDDPDWSARASGISDKVRDISELLASAGPARGADTGYDLDVCYDAPCHLLHAQRISRPPLDVLASIPGLNLIPLEDADQCCGAAGIYNLMEPEASAAVLAPKLKHIARTGAKYVITGNPGCLMQIGAGLASAGIPARAVHPVDLLDASYAAVERG